MSEPFIFGENCDPIEVIPFSPICSHPDVGGTSPLSLDVPVPVFAPAIPPNECACFTFTPVEKTTVVVKDCSRLDPPKCKVEIQQEDADCCKGKYKVTPTVEVPCIPFTIASPVVTVSGRSGGTPDGSVSVKVEPDCCTVKTKVDVKMPDCIKYYDPDALPDVQIKYWEKGVQKTHKLVSMVENASTCSIYPKVTMLPLPACPLSDSADLVHKTVQTSTDGSSIKLTLTRTNCNIGLNVGYTPGKPPVIPLPCYPTINAFNTGYKIAYKKDGTVKYYDADTGVYGYPLTITRDDALCPTFTFTAGTIDLTGVEFNDGISNGGDVNKTKEGDLIKLRIDGESDGNKTTYWGGGYGDRPDNEQPSGKGYTDVYSRGKLMRGGVSSMGGGNPIPVADVGSAFVVGDYSYTIDKTTGKWVLTEEGATDSKVHWDSGRKEIDEETGEYTWSSTANLNITWPTGAQWHTRGVAMTLTTFEFNDAGVLSWVQENGKGILMSPAPIVRYSGSGSSITEDNASGLKMYYNEANSLSSGMFVHAKNGLRVVGLDSKTSADDWSSASDDTKGSLEVYKLDSDFAFMTGDNNERLAVNDKKGTISRLMELDWTGAEYIKRKEKEFVIPILTHIPGYPFFVWDPDAKMWLCNYSELKDGIKEGEYKGTNMASFFSGIRMALLHVSSSGVVLSVDNDIDFGVSDRNIT